MKWTKSMGPKIRKEPFLGTCPVHHKDAKIWATYEGRQDTKDDIILTYHLQSYECSLIEPGKRCPFMGQCPFIEDPRYY